RRLTGYGGWITIDSTGPGCARMLLDDVLFRVIEPNCYQAAVRVAECDRLGVAMQVLSTVPVMFSYWAQAAHAHDLARVLNDHIAEVVHLHPERFIGLGTL